MTGSMGQRLVRAVLAAQGASPAEGLSAEEVAHARQLVEARRRDHDREPCPQRARRRAYALLDALPSRPWSLVARLVFDSWAEPAPASRSLGTERLLRFETPSAAVDVQVGRVSAGEAATVALAVEGGADGREARLRVDARDRTVPLALDEHGTGSTRLETTAREVVVIVEDEDGELLRTPPVALR